MGHFNSAQWGLLSDCDKVKPISNGGKVMVIVMGFVGNVSLKEIVVYSYSIQERQPLSLAIL